MRFETRAREQPVWPPSVQAKKDICVSSSTASFSRVSEVSMGKETWGWAVFKADEWAYVGCRKINA